MKVVGILAGALLVLAACVTDGNRCAGGMLFSPEYNACLDVAAADAGGTPVVDADASGDGGEGSGLGKDCGGDGDCAGQSASYCLKDPTDTSSPGICTIPQCKAADCPSGRYSCCNCSNSPIAELKAWPAGVCAPSSNKPQLEQFGCTCL